MTMDVRYTSVRESLPGMVTPEYRINGVWHRESDYTDSLEILRDADEPFRNLHCLVVFAEGEDKETSWFHCLIMQPTGVQRGQFRRYGMETILGKYYSLSIQDLKSVRNEEWLEYESVDECYSSDGKYIVSIV